MAIKEIDSGSRNKTFSLISKKKVHRKTLEKTEDLFKLRKYITKKMHPFGCIL